jgi:hypothetical protein
MRFLPALACAALAAAVPAQQASTDVAMGVFPFLVGNMDNQVGQIVRDCEQNGIDTIHVSVFRATGPRTGDLWITDRAGDWDPAWGRVRPTGAGIDLSALIREAHARKLRVVGVLKCFDDTVQPTDASHRRYLLEVVDYLVGAFDGSGRPVYDLDGLALDYVRFVGSGTGNDASLVTDFVRDVKAAIAPLSLHAYLLANRYTFDGPTYDGNFASYNSVIQGLASQYGQHWEQMARHVDVMMPMCYTADGSIYRTYALHQAYVRQAAAYCRSACNRAGFTARRVQPVVKTYTSTGETTTAQTVEASITGALLGGADGYQAFRYRTMDPSWWPVMARWAVPGPNFPVPELLVSSTGVTATLDARGSVDHDEPSSGLQLRFDTDGDGVFDTGWLPNTAFDSVRPDPRGGLVAMQVRDAQGQVSATRRIAPPGTVVSLSHNFLQASTGGAIEIRVDAGPGAAGSAYLVLGSLAGSNPGTPWTAELTVPLNLDAFSAAMLSAANTALLPNALGQLDAQGRAVARFVAPPGLLAPLGLRGLTWSVVGADAFARPWFVGDARTFVILP